MSARQRRELLASANRRQHSDHDLGTRYVPSDKLKSAMQQVHRLFVGMTAAQRHAAVHPKHLDRWLEDRRSVVIGASDTVPSASDAPTTASC